MAEGASNLIQSVRLRKRTFLAYFKLELKQGRYLTTVCAKDRGLHSFSKLKQILTEFVFLIYKTIHLIDTRMRMLAGKWLRP